MVGTAVNQRGQLSPSSSCLLPCGTGPQCGLVFGSRKSGFLRERSYLFLLAPNLVVLSFLLLAFWRHDAGWLYMDTTWGEHVGGSPVLGGGCRPTGTGVFHRPLCSVVALGQLLELSLRLSFIPYKIMLKIN